MFLMCRSEVLHRLAKEARSAGDNEVKNSFSFMREKYTPSGVSMQHRSVEYFPYPVWCNETMKPEADLVERRRALLKQEINKKSLADVSRLAGKPDRQINDMVEGRKAFGDGVAREIGQKIRPDLPRDWLIFADNEWFDAADNIACFEKIGMSQREAKINGILRLLRSTSIDGIEQVEVQAEFAATKYPLNKQTRSFQ